MDFSEQLSMFNGAAIRFYAGPKEKVAVCRMSNPAFYVDRNIGIAAPISQIGLAIGGVIKFAIIFLTDGRKVEELECGLPGENKQIELESLEIEPGGQVEVSKMIILPKASEQLCGAIGQAINIKAMGYGRRITRAEKDKAIAEARGYFDARDWDLTDEENAALVDLAEHGAVSMEIIRKLEAQDNGIE